MCYFSAVPEIKTTVYETQETTTTQQIELAPGIHAQRVTVVRRTGDQETTAVAESVQHLVETSDPNFGVFAVVEPVLLERLRLKGWFRADKDYELISKQPFTRVQEASPYAVVRLKSYDNSLFDLQGQRLPVALSYDYINGDVNDASFDLKGLLIHLQGRSDVTLHKGRFSESLIHRIPHYNAGDSCGFHGLSFTWHPEVALFREYCVLSAKLDIFERGRAAHQLMGNDPFRVEPAVAEANQDA